MMIDRDEQRIRNAFSQIPVDTESLERKVRENMNTRKMIKPTPLKRAGFIMAASIAIMILISGTVYAAATMGVFERFMAGQDPAFAEIVTPVETYTIEQGVRVDIIAAQTFGYNAIVYLSVQDISGQNRITEYVNIIPMLDIPRNSERLMGVSVIGGHEPLYFDKETNTAYFQLEFQDHVLIPNIVDIIINNIRFETRHTEVEFPVALSSITEAPLIPNLANFSNPETPTWCADYILAPTMGEGFPPLPCGGWISNVAIINRSLHVQLASHRVHITETGERSVLGAVSSGVMLAGPQGEWVAPISHTFLDVDAELNMLPRYLQQTMPLEELLEWLNSAPYHLMEIVFPIDVNALESYSLTLTGMFEHSIAGNWTMTIDTGETNARVRTAQGVVTIGNAIAESVFVTPLGVSFTGYVDGGINDGAASFRGRAVFIETPAGNILVHAYPSVGFSHMYGENTTFNGFARADAPIDVMEVTAVIIGDIRIPVV